jgi:hypothetical protein
MRITTAAPLPEEARRLAAALATRTISFMGRWAELKVVLKRLQDQDPPPLTGWPMPDEDVGHQWPADIHLAAWATDAAQELHEQFGSTVRLTVGALRYPDRVLAGRGAPAAGPPLPEAEPGQLRVALHGPLSVRSGYAARHGLLAENRTSRPAEFQGGFELIADVVDPATGAVAGGYSGAVLAVAVTHRVAPGSTETIPLLIGTDSFVPDLGYAIPPGEWGVQVTLDPALGRAVRTPVLPMTVTS